MTLYLTGLEEKNLPHLKAGFTSKDPPSLRARVFGAPIAYAPGSREDEQAFHESIAKYKVNMSGLPWFEGYTEVFKDCPQVREAFLALPGAKPAEGPFSLEKVVADLKARFLKEMLIRFRIPATGDTVEGVLGADPDEIGRSVSRLLDVTWKQGLEEGYRLGYTEGFEQGLPVTADALSDRLSAERQKMNEILKGP